jgi:hypothetical protein
MVLMWFIADHVSNAGNCGTGPFASAKGVPWVRNNPGRERDIELEAGDVLMMLLVALRQRGIDPLQGMMAKFLTKGFTDENVTPRSLLTTPGSSGSSSANG